MIELKLEALYNVRTLDDMKNCLSLVHSMSEEHRIPYGDMLTIVNTRYNDLRYVLSSSRDGYIKSHYFIYSDKDTKLCGVCELPVGKKELIELCKPNYNKLTNIHPILWMCLREDLTYDILLKGGVVLSNIQNYDVLSLGESIQFLQLDYDGKTSLICLDMWDNVNGVYCIKSKDDFEQWFKTIVTKRGYEGRLDNLSISGLFQIYFEVINTIFTVSIFEPLEINNV